MLLWRAKELLEGGGELLRAEAELAGMRLQRMLVSMVVSVALGIIGIIGLLAILAGLSIVLARSTGWGVSLLIVGGGVVLLTGIGALLMRLSGSASEPKIGKRQNSQPQAEAAEATQKMKEALEANPSRTSENPLSGIDKLKDEAIEFAIKNPVAIGSAALLAFSVIGPRRMTKTIRRSVATAALLGTLMDSLKKSDAPSDTSSSARASPDPRSDLHHATKGAHFRDRYS